MSVKLNTDDARRLVLALMRDRDPLWVQRASLPELEAWLSNYAANLPDVTATRDCVLWGYSARQPEPIKLSAGTAAECYAELAHREAVGWTCAVYGTGTAPTGLRDLARAGHTAASVRVGVARRVPSYGVPYPIEHPED